VGAPTYKRRLGGAGRKKRGKRKKGKERRCSGGLFDKRLWREKAPFVTRVRRKEKRTLRGAVSGSHKKKKERGGQVNNSCTWDNVEGEKGKKKMLGSQFCGALAFYPRHRLTEEERKVSWQALERGRYLRATFPFCPKKKGQKGGRKKKTDAAYTLALDGKRKNASCS